LAPAATEQALWRIVDQLGLPVVELVEPDVARDQGRIEGAGEIEGEAGAPTPGSAAR
jgi:hypothetical protein